MSAKHILVIENEAAIREIMQICLSTLRGWQVLTATSVSEGLHIAETKKTDLIVLDLFLLETSSIKFLKTQQNYSDLQSIPVIILSTGTHSLHPDDLAMLNVVDAIAKPFDINSLVNRIAQVLNTSPCSRNLNSIESIHNSSDLL